VSLRDRSQSGAMASYSLNERAVARAEQLIRASEWRHKAIELAPMTCSSCWTQISG
jgi:hypothetical protein